MPTKLLTACLVAAFVWGIIASANVGRVADRFQPSKTTQPVRQIKVLSVDATHRRIKHAFGETDIPVAPHRIACLSTTATDSLLALGLRPVLATTSWKEEGAVSYLADRLQGVKLIRQTGTINLEEVLAVKPDLILAGIRDARLYVQLNKIAPTVCVGSDASGNREDRILDVGDVVGKSKEARARLQEFHRHVVGAKQALAKYAPGPVVFLRFRRNTCVIYTRASMFGPLLFDELGLTPDPAMPVVMSGGGWDVLSVERLSTLHADHIFVVTDPDSEIYFRQVADTPIWRDLPAVEHGHVHRVLSSTWLGGDGVLGCEAIIHDVLDAMVPKRSRNAGS
ncbi:MAG TPA: iron-siderophore ABC transporter substrate-binding protein [Lacipirellulaceae bacterium]|nr:iron-siderophore ABC transporter substrate-binding protein [Lacipirellulaceae bacterium]